MARLDDQQAEALIAELESQPPRLYRGDIVPFLPQNVPNLTQEQAEQIMVAVLGAASELGASERSRTAFATDVAGSDVLDLEKPERDQLAKRLARVFATPAVAITAKALDLQFEYERVFHRARILTDIRPLFEDDEVSRPVSLLVAHSLKIEYHDETGHDAIYVTLDDNDLDALSRVITRAQEKSRALKDIASAASVDVLQPVGGGGEDG